MIFPARRERLFGLPVIAPLAWILSLVPAAAIPGGAPYSSPAYASLVCWEYTHRPRLDAWRESERLITLAMKEAYPALRLADRIQAGTPAQLERFLGRLPDVPDQLTVVYLAAHQSPAGQWFFPEGSEANWGTLAAGAPKWQNPNRIVMLDCCHAESATLWPEWSARIAPASLFASPADQLTPDLFVYRRRPADCAELFPKSCAWLRQHHFDDSDERVSFFGIVWLESWLERPAPPRDLNDWKNLAQAMALHATQISAGVNANECSNIRFAFPRNGE